MYTTPSSTRCNTMPVAYSNEFRSFGGRGLQLNILEYNRDSFEVQVINKNYNSERNVRLKSIAGLVVFYAGYLAWIPSRIFIVDALCLLTMLFLIYITVELVESEKVLFVSEFALQLTTEKFLSPKSTSFISATNIQDVVINEVIEDLAIKHILIIRTKGSLCHTRPIVVMFKTLQPRIECLEIIYSLFLKKLDTVREFS